MALEPRESLGVYLRCTSRKNHTLDADPAVGLGQASMLTTLIYLAILPDPLGDINRVPSTDLELPVIAECEIRPARVFAGSIRTSSL